MRVSVSKSLGRYNLCSNEKDWCLQVTAWADGGALNVSALFDEDDEPWADRPSEALDAIEERVNRPLFFSSHAKQDNETIAKMREMDLDRVWLEQRAAQLKKELDEVMEELGDA